MQHSKYTLTLTEKQLFPSVSRNLLTSSEQEVKTSQKYVQKQCIQDTKTVKRNVNNNMSDYRINENKKMIENMINHKLEEYNHFSFSLTPGTNIF